MPLHSSELAVVEKRFEPTDLLQDAPEFVCCKAREKSTGRRVILKYLKARFPLSADLVKFQSQIEFAQQLSGEYVVNVLERWQEEGRQILVMEDLGGGTLRQYAEQRLDKHFEQSSKSRHLQIFHLLLKVAQGLQYLEQHGVCHGNICPDSIWVSSAGNSVRISDFSFARSAQINNKADWQALVDSRDHYFMAPEIDSANPSNLTQQADFYSLGRVLVYLLDPKHPETGLKASDGMASFPESFVRDADIQAPGGSVLTSLRQKLFSPDSNQRFQSTSELLASLRACIAWLDSGQTDNTAYAPSDVTASAFRISDQLVGRELEMGRLLSALDRARSCESGDCSFQVIRITGKAGMGKSALARKFMRQASSRGCLIASGQYGQYRRDEPLSAILDAISGLLMQILSDSPEVQQRWKNTLQTYLGDQAGLLTVLLPTLEELLGPQPALPVIAGEMAVRRLSGVLRKFLSAFYEQGRPLVFYLDDLQWADQSSIRLLTDISRNMDDAHLLLVLAYRNDQSIALLPGRKQFLSLASDQPCSVFLELESLNLDNISEIVANALECSVAKGRPLAQLVEQKTAGDPFYIQQFLYALHHDGYISYSDEDACWLSDLSAVKRAALTEHVVSFVSSRLQDLSDEVLEVLQVMSCLGASVDIKTLARCLDRSRLDVARLVWTSLQSGLVVLERDVYKFERSANDEDPLDEFTVLYEEGLEYCLLHDRVRQAAYSLIPAEQRGRWHAQLGKRLLVHFERGDDDRSLFDILDKLGSGIEYIDEPAECESMSALCMQAGIKARAYIAYDESLSYLQRGINVIAKCAQVSNRQHRIGIHLEAATSALYASRFNTAFELLDDIESSLEAPLEILQHALISVQLRCLVNKLDEALEQGYRSLERFNRGRISQAQMKALCEPSDTSTAELAEQAASMEDQVALMLLLSMTPAAFYTTYESYHELVLSQIQFCKDRGSCSNTSLAICNYGTIFVGRGEYARAFGLYDDISKIEQRFPDPEVQRHKDVLLNSFYRQWREPLLQVATESQRSADQCIEAGDYIFASYAAVFFAEKDFFCSKELSTYEQQVGGYAEFTGQVLHQVPHYQLSVWHQFALNLIEGDLEPAELEGEAFSERQTLAVLESNNNEMILFYLYFCKALLALHFDQSMAASRNMRKAKQTLQSCSATYCGNLLGVYEVLVTFEQESAAQAQEAFARYRNSVEVNSHERQLNLGHLDLLLSALACVSRAENGQARQFFEQAIEGALNRGLVHDALFIKERLARFMATNNLFAEASQLFEQCYYDYNRWGARAKADHLRRRFSDFMPADLSL